jgi:hypothetical protein
LTTNENENSFFFLFFYYLSLSLKKKRMDFEKNLGFLPFGGLAVLFLLGIARGRLKPIALAFSF